MRRKRVRQRTSKTSFNSDSQGCPGRGSGWREEPARHSLAARGIRTTYDELQDRKFSPNYRSLAALMRDNRLKAMRSDLDMDYDSSLRSRDSFINERSRDQRKLMEIYRRNNQIPGGVPMFQARGVWSGLKRAGRKIKRGGAAVKRGVKKIGRGAKTIGRGAKTVGKKIAGPPESRRRKIGGAIKRGAQAVGGVVTKGSTWLQSKFAPRSYTVNPKRYRQTNDMMGDNLARRMNIDELMAEQKRLDQTNRALMMQWGVQEKWNDRRRDSLENRKRLHSRENDYRRLQMEMFR